VACTFYILISNICDFGINPLEGVTVYDLGAFDLIFIFEYKYLNYFKTHWLINYIN
jgi:hypothetical protein